MIKSSCGFDCSLCPVYISTVNNDLELQDKIKDKYKFKESEMCLGCLSEACAEICKTCNIKNCCKERNIENCGWCSEYLSCKKIGSIISNNLKSKEYLDSENIKYNEKKSSN